MKNVSFGTMYTVKECARSTMRQMELEDAINNKFLAREKRNGMNSTYPRTLDEMLEEDMEVDVCITHKKNGDVTIALKDRNPDNILIKDIVKPKDKIKLTINNNLPYGKAKKLITDYANKCRRLARQYWAKIPNEAGARLDNICENIRHRGGEPDVNAIISAIEEV